MLEVKIFRFDAKIDILSYMKPYVFEDDEFDSLFELLSDVRTSDPYFKFEGVQHVKINNVITPLSTKIKDIVERFGCEFDIFPLSEHRAIKDLITNDSTFYNTMLAFGDEFGDQKEFFSSLKPLFYSNDIVRYFPDDFLGNSAFVYACKLIEKYPEKKTEILKAILPSMPYFRTAKIFNKDDLGLQTSYEKIKLELKNSGFTENIDSTIASIYGCFIDTNQAVNEFNKKNFKKDYHNFSVAVYGDDLLKTLAKKLNAKICKFSKEDEEICFSALSANKDVTYKIASSILFDAFDSGSDFLLVNDKNAFYVLDTLSDKLQDYANRRLIDYYILSADEFIALAKGEVPLSLKKHKLKPKLI